MLCWEGFWVWKDCHELLAMSVISEEEEGGSNLPPLDTIMEWPLL